MVKNIESIKVVLVQTLSSLLKETGSSRALKRLNESSDFEADLGLDSLGRVEFLNRVEKTFQCKLSSDAFSTAHSIETLAPFVANAKPQVNSDHETIDIKDEPLAFNSGTAKTLLESFYQHLDAHPDRVHIYLTQDDETQKLITYRSLYEEAKQVAQGLVSRGLLPGQTVAIMLPTSEDFFASFMGIMMVGAIPVPIYPPFRAHQLEEYVRREAKLLENAQAQFLITFEQAELLSKMIRGFIPTMRGVVTVASLKESQTDLPRVRLIESDPAFIQYTSGSTGNPKGVLLSHGNIIENLAAACEAIDIQPDDRLVSWLPLYHDMGLIGFWLGSMHMGLPTALMSPIDFISRPERWLWAMHAQKGTITAAPNFAYEMCVTRIDEKNLKGLDLSSMRLALNGAEAIHPKTVRSFIEKFEPYGFKPSAFYPVYGLAESTVAMAFPPLDRKSPRFDLIDRKALETEGIAKKADEGQDDTTEFVGCGSAIPRHTLKIVDEEGTPLPERTVGAICFKGPSNMQGYYRNPAATEEIMDDGWINSGDYGYIAEGDLFITGRKKDIIIKAGRNIYPDDIEEIAAQVEGIRKGRVIAFGVEDTHNRSEKFVIVAETLEKDEDKRDDMIAQINRKLISSLGIPADEIILSKPGRIPKTSSGKLQRSACKDMYLKGHLLSGNLPVWMQFAKISLVSFGKKMQTWLTTLKHVLFTGYVGLVVAVLFLPALITIVLSPQKLAQKFARFWMKLCLILTGLMPKVTNEENVSLKAPLIFVGNHLSYLDPLFLIAVLPPGVAFIGKRELVSFAPFRWLMTKLGHFPIERTNLSQSLSDLDEISKHLKQGHSLMIFPEGTFTHIEGLRSFKMGAFKLAAETGTPVCPVILKGPRQILPAYSYLLRHNKVELKINPHIQPEGTKWPEVVALKKKARQSIAKDSVEPVFEE